MSTAAVVETRGERASQSMEGAPLTCLDQGRGRVLGSITLERCSLSLYLGRRLFLAGKVMIFKANLSFIHRNYLLMIVFPL